MASGPDFDTEARSRFLKEDTILKLRDRNIDSLDKLEYLSNDVVDRMGISRVQQGFLMTWVHDLRHTSDQRVVPGLDRVARVEHDDTTPTPGTCTSTPDTNPTEACARPVVMRHISKRDSAKAKDLLSYVQLKQRHERDTSTESQERLTQELTELNVKDLCDIIDESVMNFMDSEVNIAVCGRSGTGKSSLINCILNMNAAENGAAKVNVVECTTDPVAHKHPDMPGVLIWDLPGVGTDRYDTASYLTTVEFSRFDAYIIVCSNRIYQDDTWLAAEAKAQNKPFYFVRSKIDQDVTNAMRDNEMDENTAILTIRENAEESLMRSGVSDSKIYIVSGIIRYQWKWDFSLLMEELIKRTPSKSVTAMVMAMVSCSTEIIAKKKEDFAKRINTIASEAAVPASPYKQLILKEIILYKERFGITTSVLRKWEVEVDKLEPKLRNIKEGLVSLIESLNKEKVKQFLWKLATHPLFADFSWAKNLAERTTRRWSIMGSSAKVKAEKDSTDLIQETTRQTLETALDQCEQLALGVLQQRSAKTLRA